LAIEHFGSTSIPGLCAKPVVDILIGLNEFVLSNNEIYKLKQLGYTFIETSAYCERFYFKKCGKRRFNLSIVRFSGNTWNDCVSVRNYLQTHPNKIREYAAIKLDAIAHGNTTLPAYSRYKYKFVRQLLIDAKSL
jgi:GrpB-like predicted nucleotidyltransferase (UPF0157 family)